MLANKDLFNTTQKPEDDSYSENDDDLAEERYLADKKLIKQHKDDREDEEEKQLFMNPLIAFEKADKKKADDSDPDVWSDDDKYEPK